MLPTCSWKGWSAERCPCLTFPHSVAKAHPPGCTMDHGTCTGCGSRVRPTMPQKHIQQAAQRIMRPGRDAAACEQRVRPGQGAAACEQCVRPGQAPATQWQRMDNQTAPCWNSKGLMCGTAYQQQPAGLPILSSVWAATSSRKCVAFQSAQALPLPLWRAALELQAWHFTDHMRIRGIQLKDAGLQQHHMPLGAVLCLLAHDSPHQHGQNDRVGT